MTSVSQPTLLVTGGAGFIGSHVCAVLLDLEISLVVLDSLVNGTIAMLEEVAQLAGLARGKNHTWRHPRNGVSLHFVHGDIRSAADLDQALRLIDAPTSCVLHLAGLKSPAESLNQAFDYWDVNVGGTLHLIEAMRRHGCRRLVFSSSASVYGPASTGPIHEASPLAPQTPYAATKAAIERCLQDMRGETGGWQCCILRYFNPIGAHPSGAIGESPRQTATNIFPRLCAVARGSQAHLDVYGSDWPTPDGTGVRDYLHVMDLAEAHARAAMTLLDHQHDQLILNLGTGQGHSVLELIQAFESANDTSILHRLLPRRAGDVAMAVADPSRAEAVLGWSARRTLRAMCRDGWAWAQRAGGSG